MECLLRLTTPHIASSASRLAPIKDLRRISAFQRWNALPKAASHLCSVKVHDERQLFSQSFTDQLFARNL
jgi:hypothetical protein